MIVKSDGGAHVTAHMRTRRLGFAALAGVLVFLAHGMAPAVTPDAIGGGNAAGVATVTFAHTCSGLNRVLIVGISQGSNTSVTSVTYAGTAMTSLGVPANNGNKAVVSMYYLAAPATGANNVVVTWTGNVNAIVGSVSFTGVDQTTPVGTFAKATGTSTAPSVNVTSGNGQLVVDTVAVETNVALAVGAGQAQQWNASIAGQVQGGGSTELGAATVTMSWSFPAPNKRWAIGGVAVKPVTSDQKEPSGGGGWASVATMTNARAIHQMAKYSNQDTILVTGGHDGAGPQGTTEALDVGTGAWTVKAPMATARYAHRAVPLGGGLNTQVLVVGGLGGTDTDNGAIALASAELWDSATNTWASAGSMSTARWGHTATVLSNGQVLVAGGLDDNGNVLSTTTIWTGGTTWVAGPAMTVARAFHEAAPANGTSSQVLLIGGYNSASGVIGNCDLFAVGTPNTIAATGSMATRRMSFQAAYLSTPNVAVACGGWGGAVGVADAALSSVERWSGGAWSAGSSMGSARVDHRAIGATNDRLVVAGGWSTLPGDYSAIFGIASSQTYTGSTNAWAAAEALSTGAWEGGIGLTANGNTLVRTGGWVLGAASAKAVVAPPGFPPLPEIVVDVRGKVVARLPGALVPNALRVAARQQGLTAVRMEGDVVMPTAASDMITGLAATSAVPEEPPPPGQEGRDMADAHAGTNGAQGRANADAMAGTGRSGRAKDEAGGGFAPDTGEVAGGSPLPPADEGGHPGGSAQCFAGSAAPGTAAACWVLAGLVAAGALSRRAAARRS